MNVLVATVALAASLVPQTSAREWETDYAKAFQVAQQTRRPLLVVLERPAEVRHQVRQASFTVDPTMNELLKPYVLCRVDVTTPYGREVAKAFSAKEFPLTAITDRTVTTLVFKKVGSFSTQEWVQTLITYQKGERPQLQPEYFAPAQDPGLVYPGQVQCFT